MTVSNRSSTSGQAYLYGPALAGVTHVYPPLQPTTIGVRAASSSRTYIGFVLPRIALNKSVRLILRLVSPQGPQSIVATDRRVVHASARSIVDNPDCTIRKPA